MCEYYSIPKVCGTLSGLRALLYTDMTNIVGHGPGSLPPVPGNPPDFNSADEVYQISIQKFSGIVSRESGSDDGGDYVIGRVTGFIPKTRRQVDTLLRRMRNRYFAVIAVDRHGLQHLLFNARGSYKHTTGQGPGEPHGYSITFTAPEHFILPSVGDTGTPVYIDPIDPIPDPEPAADCCVEIKPIQIAYTPLPTGNETDLNLFVTTQDGALYFIDHNGRSVVINRPAPLYYSIQVGDTSDGWVVIPDEYPLPDPDDYPSPTYDTQAEISRRLMVINQSRKVAYDHDEGYDIDYATRRVHILTPIAGAFLEFYFHQRITPIPL